MKIFGRDATNLHLTDAAQAVYNNSDPLKIVEIESNGEIFYNISGIIERGGLTEEEVNDALESLDLTEYRIKPEFLSRWGSWTTEDTIVTRAEVKNLANEWGTPFEELMEQLIPVE